MEGSSAKILGDFRAKPCLRKAGGLIYDSYGRDGSQVHPDLRPWINDAWNTWERPAGSDIMDHPSGFHARFYRPKGSDPDAPVTVRRCCDEPGVKGGVKSGVNLGWCRPKSNKASVFVEGRELIRNDNLYEMNCNGPDGPSNTIGRLVYYE